MVVVSFMIAVPFSLGAPLVGGLSPLLRTPLPRSDTASGSLWRISAAPEVRVAPECPPRACWVSSTGRLLSDGADELPVVAAADQIGSSPTESNTET